MAEPARLHGFFLSSAAFRVRIALNLKGTPYESVARHLRKNEQRAPDYLALNPQGLVPTLEIEGRTLVQSLAIIEYLDETFPNAPILPADPVGRARVRAIAQAVASDIHPLGNLRVLRYLRHQCHQDQGAVQSWYNHWIAEGFGGLEPMLRDSGETGAFCHGDTPSLADICLVPQVINARTYKLDLSPYPTIQRVFEAAMKLPAFERALPENQPDAE